jgi:hypothetical protein
VYDVTCLLALRHAVTPRVGQCRKEKPIRAAMAADGHPLSSGQIDARTDRDTVTFVVAGRAVAHLIDPGTWPDGVTVDNDNGHWRRHRGSGSGRSSIGPVSAMKRPRSANVSSLISSLIPPRHVSVRRRLSVNRRPAT